MKGYKIGISKDEKSVFMTLIELNIPEGYPGLKIFGNKHFQLRSNVARVVKINNFFDSNTLDYSVSLFNYDFVYRPGELIYPDFFDPNPNNICTNGIHFFRESELAKAYSHTEWAYDRLIQYTIVNGFRIKEGN